MTTHRPPTAPDPEAWDEDTMAHEDLPTCLLEGCNCRLKHPNRQRVREARGKRKLPTRPEPGGE